MQGQVSQKAMDIRAQTVARTTRALKNFILNQSLLFLTKTKKILFGKILTL